MDYKGRLRRLREELARRRLEALLVTHLPNVRYLTGFTGSSAALVISEGKAAFFTDGRYTEQAHEEVQGARVHIAKGAVLTAAARWISDGRLKSVGFESERMTVATRDAAAKAMGKRTRLRPVAGLIEQLRIIKDEEELARIRAAVELASELFEGAMKAIRAGVAESAVAAELEYAARRAGAEGMSFETIVAGGARSAMPHGRASSQAIPNRGFVILDYGVILAGYCSDMTRTVHVGQVTARERDMYEAVREAQEAGIAAVRAGVAAGEVDAAARKVLQRAGRGKYFTHSTGHGVGLEIHEPPRLGRGQTELLRPGMVVTVEPGIYVPGKGGVRIEDIVHVTERGCDVLTPTTKELLSV